MDGRTDGRTDRRMDGWMDGRMDGWMDGWVQVQVWYGVACSPRIYGAIEVLGRGSGKRGVVAVDLGAGIHDYVYNMLNDDDTIKQ